MNRIDKLIKTLCPQGVEYKQLGEVCSLSRGKVISKEYLRNNIGVYPVYSSQTENNGILGLINTFDYEGTYITWTTDGAHAGSIFYHEDKKFNITNVCGLIKNKSNIKLKLKFIYYILSIRAKKYVNRGMGNPKLMSNQITKIPIPIPPMEVQEEIVAILDLLNNNTNTLLKELKELRIKQYKYYLNELTTCNTNDII